MLDIIIGWYLNVFGMTFLVEVYMNVWEVREEDSAQIVFMCNLQYTHILHFNENNPFQNL